VTGLHIRLVLVGALATSVLAGCSSAPNLLSSDAGWFSKPLTVFEAPSWNSTTRINQLSSRPVGPEDLLAADGSCPSGSSPVAAATDGAAGAPADAAAPSGGGLALDMSECDVVRRAGAPERFEIGNEGGQRTALLTYLHGARPGIYRFVGGRLVSVERAPEAPAPAKPQRAAKRRA
jgi:hypothetical protein